MTWTLEQMPDLQGKHALVTGVTGDLGHHTALQLALAGARVTMTGRNEHALKETTNAVAAKAEEASLEMLHLDLADLTSVRRAAAVMLKREDEIDILVNNAGVMATPERRTVDGFELQLGTNHFGHFALTGLLLPILGNARVVTLTSLMHRFARSVPRSDPRMPDRYNRWRAYSQSKLANLQFALELERRARNADLGLVSVAAHPGYAATRLQTTGPQLGGPSMAAYLLAGATRIVGQPAATGALPILYAATLPGIEGGTLVGPAHLMGLRGAPRIAQISRPAKDPVAAAGLWQLSEQATSVTFLS